MDRLNSPLNRGTGPTALLFTRQKLPILDRTVVASATGVEKGGYILLDTDRVYPDVILIASGSEVHFAVEAHRELTAQGIAARVVSMPSWELFEAQTDAYRDSVLPPSVSARVAIEAGVTLGWDKYIGSQGTIIGLDRFGASAPYQTIYEHLGFTTENVVLRALATIDKSKK